MQTPAFLICQYLFCARNPFPQVPGENGATRQEMLCSLPRPTRHPWVQPLRYAHRLPLASEDLFLFLFKFRLRGFALGPSPSSALRALCAAQGANASFPHLSPTRALFACKSSERSPNLKKIFFCSRFGHFCVSFLPFSAIAHKRSLPFWLHALTSNPQTTATGFLPLWGHQACSVPDPVGTFRPHLTGLPCCLELLSTT